MSEEQPDQALRRELHEEVGVDIGIVRQEPVLRRTDQDIGVDVTVWLVTTWAGTVETANLTSTTSLGGSR